MSALPDAHLADDVAIRRLESRIKGINAQLRDFNDEIQSWTRSFLANPDRHASGMMNKLEGSLAQVRVS